MSKRMLRRAKRISSAPGVPPEVRERIRDEVLGHLRDSAADYRSLGHGARAAERLALRDFGDPKKTRQDLGRAFRGKRTVLFPDEPGSRFAHFRLYDLKAVLVILAIVFLLRWQVVAAYHIPTKSMEPTLHGDPASGDKILVYKLFYQFHDPERWQVAVFEREADDRNLIKRIVGLPGETVDVRHGDVYIGGEIARKPRDVQADLLVPVYTDDRDVLADESEDRRGLAAWTATGRWSEEAGRYVAEATEEEQASLAWTRPVEDVYPGGSDRSRDVLVGDLVLRFRVEPGEEAQVVGGCLREGEDCFEVQLPVGSGDTVLLRGKQEVARAPGVALVAGEEQAVRFANLDDRVTVDVGGITVISFDVPDASTGPPDGDPVAELGIRKGTAAFSHVELLRDIHYFHEGKLPAKIPAGHYFMMGDNSGNSSDSRDWGTVSRDRLIGRPLLVFWPLSRAKILH